MSLLVASSPRSQIFSMVIIQQKILNLKKKRIKRIYHPGFYIFSFGKGIVSLPVRVL